MGHLKKKWLVIGLGILLLVLLIGFAVFGVFGSPQSFSSAKTEAIIYADTVLPEILNAEDDQVLASHLSSEYLSELRQFQQQQNSQMVGAIRSFFGRLKSHSEAKTKEVKSGLVLPYGFVSNVILSYDAEFEKAPAVIEIDLIKRRGNWYIQGFFVSSPNNAKYKDWGNI